MNGRWLDFLASLFFTLMVGSVCIGSIMVAGATLASLDWFAVGFFLFIGLMMMPLFWMGCGDLKEAATPLFHRLRWRFGRIKEAFLEPMPESEGLYVYWEEREAG